MTFIIAAKSGAAAAKATVAVGAVEYMLAAFASGAFVAFE